MWAPTDGAPRLIFYGFPGSGLGKPFFLLRGTAVDLQECRPEATRVGLPHFDGGREGVR